MRPSLSMLSHTRQNTSNFCALSRVSALSQRDITRIICALLVIIRTRDRGERGQEFGSLYQCSVSHSLAQTHPRQCHKLSHPVEVFLSSKLAVSQAVPDKSLFLMFEVFKLTN